MSGAHLEREIAGRVAVWLGADLADLVAWEIALDNAEVDDPAPRERPHPTFRVDQSSIDALVIAWLRGPEGPPGPMGPQGMSG